MAEYIEREAVLMYAKMFVHIAYNRSNPLRDEEIEKAVNEIPAADVAPVRHGRWISDGHGKRFGTVVRLDKDGCPVDTCHCSECGEWLTASDEYAVVGRYCPNCGAKMDGGE